MKIENIKINKKKLLENTITLEEFEKKHFTPDQIEQIEEGANLYIMMSKFRDEKEKQSLTNEEIAKKSKIPRPEVSKILNGKTNVSVERLFALAKGLGKRLEFRLV